LRYASNEFSNAKSFNGAKRHFGDVTN
jgi:hypothetical protein